MSTFILSKVSKSRLVSLISWVQVLRIYIPAALIGIIVLAAGQVLHALYEHRFDFVVSYI